MTKILVTKEVKGVKFGGSSCPEYTVDIPSGLRVRPVPNEKGIFWVNEFSPWKNKPELFMMLHDAETRGIRLTSEQVQEVEK